MLLSGSVVLAPRPQREAAPAETLEPDRFAGRAEAAAWLGSASRQHGSGEVSISLPTWCLGFGGAGEGRGSSSTAAWFVSMDSSTFHRCAACRIGPSPPGEGSRSSRFAAVLARRCKRLDRSGSTLTSYRLVMVYGGNRSYPTATSGRCPRDAFVLASCVADLARISGDTLYVR
jgi:hypothetical protein